MFPVKAFTGTVRRYDVLNFNETVHGPNLMHRNDVEAPNSVRLGMPFIEFTFDCFNPVVG